MCGGGPSEPDPLPRKARDADVEAAELATDEARERRKRGMGFSDTLLSGAMSENAPSAIRKKTLLGE